MVSGEGSIDWVFGDCVALGLGEGGHALALGQILPDEAVGVLVRARSQLWCGVAKQNFTGRTASTCAYQWNSVPLSDVMGTRGALIIRFTGELHYGLRATM